MNNKSIKNVVTSLVYKIVACVVGLLIPRLFIISYGSELNGLQSSIGQFFTYIALIEAGVGEVTLQSLFNPIAEKKYQKCNEILSATTIYYNRIGGLYLTILLGFAFLYPVVIQVESVPYTTVVCYIIFSGLVNGLNFFFQAKIILVLQASGEMYINNLVTMGVYCLTSAIKIGCIMLGLNIVFIQVGFFLANICGTFIYYIVVKKKFSWLNFKAEPDMGAIEQRNAALVHKISGLVFQNTDIIILSFFCGLKVVSIYTMYKLVINMITTVIASFADSVNHVFGQTYNGKSLEEYCRKIDAFNVLYSSLAFALFTITSILIIPFLQIYTKGMDQNYIYPLLPFLYISIEVLQVGREAMLRTITVAGHFQKTIYAAIIETAINLVVSISAVIIFKKLWGETAGLFGALLGTIAALMYRTIDINRYANHNILMRKAWKSNKLILTNIAIYIFIGFVLRRVELNVNTYLQLIGYGLVLTVVIVPLYLIIQLLINKKEAKDVLDVVLKKR
ncbi:MAG: hypothetical protein PHW34_00845 [Hespellia sp.]|nr:hypothetical protein [Hespellia sp.]